MKSYTAEEQIKLILDIKINELREEQKLDELTNELLEKYIKAIKECVEKCGKSCKNIDNAELIKYARRYHHYLVTLPKNAIGVSLLNPESPY